MLLTSSDLFVDAGSTAESNYWNLFSSSYGQAPRYSLIGDVWFKDPCSAASGSATLGVTVNLNPGDAVWVWAFLQTPAADGSIVDASHTFETGWDDITDLVPANVYVPEPGTLALLGLAAYGRQSHCALETAGKGSEPESAGAINRTPPKRGPVSSERVRFEPKSRPQFLDRFPVGCMWYVKAHSPMERPVARPSSFADWK